MPIMWIINDMDIDFGSEESKVLRSDSGFYSLKTAKNNDGGGIHPSLNGHKVIAKELTEFICNMM